MHDKATLPNIPMKGTPSAMHRRQMIWQVWVPLAAGILIFLALAALTIVGAVQGSSQVERWGDISAIWVIIPVLIFGLVPLAIFAGGAYGLAKLLEKMPGWMLKAQLFMVHLALVFRRIADATTKPVVAVNTFSARVSTLWNNLFHRKATH